MSDSDHPTISVAEASDDTSDLSPNEPGVPAAQPPALSPNPATNALIADIVLRGVSKLSRETVEAILGVKQAKDDTGKDNSGEEAKKPSLVFSLAAIGATKLATRSLPGFAIVSTGLVAKTLFDRSQSKRKARRKAKLALQEQVDPDNEQ